MSGSGTTLSRVNCIFLQYFNVRLSVITDEELFDLRFKLFILILIDEGLDVYMRSFSEINFTQKAPNGREAIYRLALQTLIIHLSGFTHMHYSKV